MQKKASLREDLAGALRTILGSLSMAFVVAATVLGMENGLPTLLLFPGWVAAVGSLLVLIPRDPLVWRFGRIAAGLSVGVSTLMLSAVVSAVLGAVDAADSNGPFVAHFFMVAVAGGVGLWAAEIRLAWDADRTSRQQHSDLLEAISAAMQPPGLSRPQRSPRAGWPTWSLAAASAVAWYFGSRRRRRR